MKRPTIESIEQHVAHEVVKYLEQADVEKKRLKYSVEALREGSYSAHDCPLCGLWFQSESAEDATMCCLCDNWSSCGLFGCAPLWCSVCESVSFCPDCETDGLCPDCVGSE